MSSSAPDPQPAWLVLAPSRSRRRWLLFCAAALSLLAALLLSTREPAAHLGAAVTAALAALAAVRARHDAPWPAGGPLPTRTALALPSALGATVAESVSAGRLVLRGPQGRTVVWRDAVDPASYRRMAVAARWPARGRPR